MPLKRRGVSAESLDAERVGGTQVLKTELGGGALRKKEGACVRVVEGGRRWSRQSNRAALSRGSRAAVMEGQSLRGGPRRRRDVGGFLNNLHPPSSTPGKGRSRGGSNLMKKD